MSDSPLFSDDSLPPTEKTEPMMQMGISTSPPSAPYVESELRKWSMEEDVVRHVCEIAAVIGCDTIAPSADQQGVDEDMKNVFRTLDTFRPPLSLVSKMGYVSVTVETDAGTHDPMFGGLCVLIGKEKHTPVIAEGEKRPRDIFRPPTTLVLVKTEPLHYKVNTQNYAICGTGGHEKQGTTLVLPLPSTSSEKSPWNIGAAHRHFTIGPNVIVTPMFASTFLSCECLHTLTLDAIITGHVVIKGLLNLREFTDMCHISRECSLTIDLHNNPFFEKAVVVKSRRLITPSDGLIDITCSSIARTRFLNHGFTPLKSLVVMAPFSDWAQTAHASTSLIVNFIAQFKIGSETDVHLYTAYPAANERTLFVPRGNDINLSPFYLQGIFRKITLPTLAHTFGREVVTPSMVFAATAVYSHRIQYGELVFLLSIIGATRARLRIGPYVAVLFGWGKFNHDAPMSSIVDIQETPDVVLYHDENPVIEPKVLEEYPADKWTGPSTNQVASGVSSVPYYLLFKKKNGGMPGAGTRGAPMVESSELLAQRPGECRFTRIGWHDEVESVRRKNAKVVIAAQPLTIFVNDGGITTMCPPHPDTCLNLYSLGMSTPTGGRMICMELAQASQDPELVGDARAQKAFTWAFATSVAEKPGGVPCPDGRHHLNKGGLTSRAATKLLLDREGWRPPLQQPTFLQRMWKK